MEYQLYLLVLFNSMTLNSACFSLSQTPLTSIKHRCIFTYNLSHYKQLQGLCFNLSASPVLSNSGCEIGGFRFKDKRAKRQNHISSSTSNYIQTALRHRHGHQTPANIRGYYNQACTTQANDSRFGRALPQSTNKEKRI